MKLGVAGLLPPWQKIDREACERVRKVGFRGAQWFIPDPANAEAQEIERVRRAFAEADLEICQLNGSYTSLVSQDPARRAQGIEEMRALVRIGAKIGAYCVYVRPGGLNPAGDWYAHPDHKKTETFERLADSIRQVSQTCALEGVNCAIEGHVLSPLYDVDTIVRLMGAVNSPNLKFNADPVNFLGTLEDVFASGDRIRGLFNKLGSVTVAAHAKDVDIENKLVLHIDEVLLGTGKLDYEVFLSEFERHCPQGYILIEHLPDALVPAAREELLRIANKIGIDVTC